MTDTAPRAWVGCLGCYNGGRLAGEWLTPDQCDDLAGSLPNAVLATYEGTSIEYVRCTACGSDEWWVFDHEGLAPFINGECSPGEVSTAAGIIEAIESESYIDADAVLAWVEAMEVPTRGFEWDAPTREQFEDEFRGHHDSFRDYADEWADEMLGAFQADVRETSTWAPEYVNRGRREQLGWITRYFDYEAHARDMRHGFTVVDAPDGGVYVFLDSGA